MGAHDHRRQAEETASAHVSVFTVSDTRTLETDESGKVAIEILTKYGHTVLEHRILGNDRRGIVAAVGSAIRGSADAVITLGGTGISKKDVSIEAVREHIVKELPGFGELFRDMSRKEIGSAAMMSRAVLGVTAEGKLVASLPGSPSAVRLGLEEILVQEMKHLLWELRRHA